MYKEVSGSLIKWPAAASAAMLAMSWCVMDPDGDMAVRSVKSSDSSSNDMAITPDKGTLFLPSPIAPVPYSEGFDSAVAEQVSDPQRDDAAMRLPERIANALAEDEPLDETVSSKSDDSSFEGKLEAPFLQAPVRLIEQELAGLDLRGMDDEFAGQNSGGVQDSGSSMDASGSGVRNVDEGDLFILEQCEQFAWASASWITEPWSESFWQPGDELAKLASKKPKSVLPESNRVLGRRDLLQAETQEAVVGPAWANATTVVRARLRTAKEMCNDLLVTLAQQSTRLNDFASEHQLEDRLAAEARSGETRAATSSVVPVGGIISAENEIAVPQVQQSVSRNVSSARVVRKEHVAAWPEATQLIDQLNTLTELSENLELQSGFRFVSVDGSELTIAGWASRVQRLLADLRSLPRLGAKEAGEIIVALNRLAVEGQKQAELLADRESQVHWLRAVHAITRRTAIWLPVWSLSQGQGASWESRTGDTRVPLEIAVQQVRDDLVTTGDVEGWNTFLMLDEVLEQANSGTAASRVIVSQRLMSRLQWHSLRREHSSWLKRDSIDQLVAAIRPWAQTVVDYVALVEQLEQQEANAIDLAAVDIASAAQTLRFADSPLAVKVSEGLNTYYRNANVRFAISERFIERMIPAIEQTSMPVNTRMMGARVTGVSQIKSEFDIDLQPANDRWLLKLKANGRVQTDSVGRQGVVAVRTAASARFDAASQIEVTRQGLYVGNADAKVRSSTRLRGVETSYDGWPLVGTLVRSIAEERYRDMAPQANRLANRETRTRIEKEMDAQIESRVDEAAVAVSEMVLGPLGRLQLDPYVTDMQTTDHRLLARYRVAGDWQLGAFTPRPRALSDSLMSVQLHQSALNNTLEQLIPSDRTIAIRDLIRKSFGTFGKPEVDIPEDIPADVTVQFARTRPVTVEIEDGMLWLTLRVLRLRRQGGVDLTQFIVRVGYRPEVDGMNARLVREGHLRISGPRMAMRERLPARAIFNKVFAASREIPLTVPRLAENPAAEGLVVSQLELRDGWLAMAISEAGAARIALRQE